MNLTEILPQPKTITLAGREFRVSSFRVVDLAVIQSWLEEVVPHPLEDHREKIENAATERDRRKALLRLQRITSGGSWPPVYPSPIARLLFASRVGSRFFLSTVLGRENDLDEDALDHLVAHITPEERNRLNDVLWGHTPQREYESLLNPPRQGRKGKLRDWCETFAVLALRYGLTPAEIGQLTLDQVNVLSSGGGRKAASDWTAMTPEERQARWEEQWEILEELKAEEEQGEE